MSADLGTLRLPEKALSPVRSLIWRIGFALALMATVVLLVFLDREGYTDNSDGQVDFLDAIYYTTVTMTTTGYGDITPVSETARLVNIIVITPLRVMFLILLVGTTLEVLATQGRERLRLAQWRRRMRDHVVIVGYGTKGQSAVETLTASGVDPESIIVIDPSNQACLEAKSDGIASIMGDATRRDVLERAEASRAKQIIITTNRDDSAVLTTLTARQVNPHAHIIAAVRELENIHLLKQSGANATVTSSDAVGRMLGIASSNPEMVEVLDDLLTPGQGLEVGQRPVHPDEVGRSPKWCSDQVLAVNRGGVLFRYYQDEVKTLQRGDILVVVRDAGRPAKSVDANKADENPPALDNH